MLRKFMFFIAGIGILVLSSIATAAIYRNILPDGTLSFSDTAAPGSEVVTLSSKNLNNFTARSHESNVMSKNDDSTSTIPSATATSSPMTSTSSSEANYESITISSPADQTTIQNQAPVTVTVNLAPPLKEGDKIQLTIDGKPYKQPETTTSIIVDDLTRGTHQIQARVLTAYGSQLTSLPITIYKHQASPLLNPGR